MQYGWISLLPPLVAIGLAILTRRVVLSLLLGVIVAAVLVVMFQTENGTVPPPAGVVAAAPEAKPIQLWVGYPERSGRQTVIAQRDGRVHRQATTLSDNEQMEVAADRISAALTLDAAWDEGLRSKLKTLSERTVKQRPTVFQRLGSTIHLLLEGLLWSSLADASHLRVFAFTLLMGGMIGVIQESGGMEAVVRGLAPLARSRRGGQLLTWCLGLIVFIDDYANTLLIGHTMRPLTDRLRISREKLAYLVDCTAAPVSGLALISTWVAGEIGYIESGFEGLAMDAPVSGMAIFIETIPYRFYVLWALLLVPLVALLNRDLGPMHRAEQAAANGTPDTTDEGAAAADDETSGPALACPVPPSRQRWLNAVVPILVTVVVTVGLLYSTGLASDKLGDSRGWTRQVLIFGNGDSYLALLYASLSGLLTAAVLVAGQRLLSFTRLREAAFRGACMVLPALTILWLAWALSSVTTDHLHTGEYLGSLLGGSEQAVLDPRWMPTIVFLLASVVAFSTGTSWGTMGILIPIVIGTTARMLTAGEGTLDPHQPLLLATIGGVLAGAIFGDHCSPISDTTILSSQASGCDHVAHVRTQLPYAILVGGVSIVLGTLPVAFGMSPWILLPLGVLVMTAILWLFGKRVEIPAAVPADVPGSRP